MRRLLRTVLLMLCLGAMGWVFVRRAYLLRATREPSPAQLALLREEGLKAIPARDVPVAALLVLGDSVIGLGHNTQRAMGDAAGHAEVNAVSDAVRRLGWDAFRGMDRDSLWLLTTFEPCPMCKGMMQEHRIRHVAFLKPKGLRHWWRSDAWSVRYELERREAGHEDLQDDLFRAHPGFDPRLMDP